MKEVKTELFRQINDAIKIDSFAKVDEKLKKSYKNKTLFSIIFCCVFAVVVTTAIIILVLAFIVGIKALEIPGFVCSAILQVSVYSAIAVWFIWKKSKTKVNEQVFEDFLKSNEIQKLYLKYYEEEFEFKGLTNFEFKFNSTFTEPSLLVGSVRNFNNLIRCPELNENNSYFSFVINGHKGEFQIDYPKIFAEPRTSRGVDGKAFISNTKIFLDSTKFDSSLNGLVVRLGKPEKDEYQNESIMFNDFFNINTSITDFRAAKFLTPKNVEIILENITENFYSIGFNNRLFSEHFYNYQFINTIGQIDKEKTSSLNYIVESIYKKIKMDFDLFKVALDLVNKVNN
ncbi:hypothetical protein SCHIN_v1c09420 [Spiroplasma chinense]|uniref:DUF3137 domain-containing protein n=1 Tax=Spiroplasma chinense TaxID=216932 RepID=A0A5B9Y5N7_9MOLU|nr:hypothetical protein [Spiroplasma chinense]QEH62135.1 hypothetical protein SCHIN_v1c09420 [Spiroplasma chinense]